MKQKIQQHLRSFFTKNLSLKLMALLLAVLVWVAFITLEDPLTTDTYTIGLKVENLEEFLANDQYIELKNGKDINNVQLKVTIQGRGSVLNALKQEDISSIITASTDVYEAEGGALKIKYEIDSAYENKIELVSLLNTSYLEVKTEGKTTKTIPLQWAISGEVAEGYVYFEDDETIDPSSTSIDVMGPESKVEEFAYGQIQVVMHGEAEDVYKKLEVNFYRDDGSKISYSKDLITTSVSMVSINVPVYKIRSLVIRPQITDQTAPEYAYMNDVTLSVQSVQVYGKEKDVNSLWHLELPEVSLLDMTENFSKEYKLADLIEDQFGNAVHLYDQNTKVNLSFSIVKKEVRTMTFSADRLEITGLSEGWQEHWRLTPTVPEITVQVMGLPEDLDAFAQIGTFRVSMKEDPLKETTYGPYTAEWSNVPSSVVIQEEVRISLECKMIIPDTPEESGAQNSTEE